MESDKSTQKVHGTVPERITEVIPRESQILSTAVAAGAFQFPLPAVVPTAGDTCSQKLDVSPHPSMQQMESNNPPAVSFVFSSIQEPKLKKALSWKRLARSKMDEKGSVQNMEMDPVLMAGKRFLEQDDMVCDHSEGVGKRMKQNTSDASSTFFSAEVGPDQPRPSL